MLSELSFVIVDDDSNRIVSYRKHLIALGAESDRIWPPKNDVITVSNWREMDPHLQDLNRSECYSPGTNCVIAILDLGLRKKTDLHTDLKDIQERVATGHLADHCNMLITQHSLRPNDEAPLEGHVDLIEHWSNLSGSQSVDITRRILLSWINIALDSWSERSGRTRPIFSEGNIEVRMAEGMTISSALLDPLTLEQVGKKIAGQAEEITVDVLAGGFSETLVCNVMWTNRGSKNSAICKLAQSKEILVSEKDHHRSAMSKTETFAPFLIQTESPENINGDCWVMLISKVDGPTFEELFCVELSETDNKCGKQKNDNMKKTASFLTNCAVDIQQRSFIEIFTDRANKHLLSRVTLPLLQVQEIASHMDPTHLPYDKKEVMQQISRLIENVDQIIVPPVEHRLSAMLPVYFQHGDLHTRNLLIDSTGQLRLIDLARFREWPIGFDACRLILTIILRACDHHSFYDQYPNNLKDWWEHIQPVFAALSGTKTTKKSRKNSSHSYATISSIVACLNKISPKISREKEIDQQLVFDTIMYCLLRDAMTLCCFSDVSPFKKLLFSLIVVQCADELDLLSGRVGG